MELYSTERVAELLGTSQEYIRVVLQRHPELQPKAKIATVWVWTAEDIERFKNRERSKGGRPRKTEDSE